MADGVLLATMSGLDQHDTGAWHPERAARLPAVERAIAAAPLGEAVVPLVGRAATPAEVGRVHDAPYLRALADLADAGGGSLDPDTTMSAGSWVTALVAAGTGLAAVDALDRGEASAAFVALRPPGHHATRDRAMGFCLVNHVAVTAAALAERGERVLVLDWDVHHGNGTQDIFWNDARVLYVSLHQSPAYPGTGRVSEVGGPDAVGLTVNVPLPPGATGDVALLAFDEVVAPAVEAFAPTWVLLSAGFDAHRDDPLADLAWTAGDYAELTHRVQSVSHSSGRTIAFLEGGYDLDALGRSAATTVAALAGVPWRAEPASSGGPGRSSVVAAAAARSLLVERRA